MGITKWFLSAIFYQPKSIDINASLEFMTERRGGSTESAVRRSLADSLPPKLESLTLRVTGSAHCSYISNLIAQRNTLRLNIKRLYLGWGREVDDYESPNLKTASIPAGFSEVEAEALLSQCQLTGNDLAIT